MHWTAGWGLHRLGSWIELFVVISMLRIHKSTGFLVRRSVAQTVLARPFASAEVPSQVAEGARNAKVKKIKPVAENKYTKTIFLPQTSFDQRADAVNREPATQKWWEDNNIYKKLSESNPGEVYVLHDGPPYANGDLHIGHALNKILKDFVNRYQLLKGRKVRYVPGWDCHGLPIEQKVLQSLTTAQREALTPTTLRKTAAAFASSTIESQKKAFKRYGVWGDWEDAYTTMQPRYEAAQLEVFATMLRGGQIYRGKKPVYWSPSSRTALAEAELEYPDNHVSRSVYVSLPVIQPSQTLGALLSSAPAGAQVALAVWTTTPWTLTANVAVAVHDELAYSLVSRPASGSSQLLIVASGALPNVCKVLAWDPAEVVTHGELRGEELRDTLYAHPLAQDLGSGLGDLRRRVVSGGDYITTDSGTGLVHLAPAHGEEDFALGARHALATPSPVDDAGRFTAEAGARFVGKEVTTDGTAAVIEALGERGVLLKEQRYAHKYPYDWRTKKPVITRLTSQWFASVSGFKQDALRAIDEVTWTPPTGRMRISAMVSGRGDWCISRQRVWGVPIPAFHLLADDEQVLLDDEVLRHVQALVAQHGADVWWERSVEELLPPSHRPQAHLYRKGGDTMDVWFDSGTSWAGVLRGRGEQLHAPAELYLEGSDQSRGWFQSSLLTAVACQGTAPYRQVVTHGFVLDEKGQKMSKSLGNVVSPQAVIEGAQALGADTLRLWVAGVDYANDVLIGPAVMKQVAEHYRKVRNTFRFLLGALSDFRPAQHAVSDDQLPALDRYLLTLLRELEQRVTRDMDAFAFLRATGSLMHFMTTDLSQFYLDVAKDRLYIAARDSPRRRSCQTALSRALQRLAVLYAPVLPHLSEEVWQALPFAKDSVSVFEQRWPASAAGPLLSEQEMARWATLRSLRSDVHKSVELARQAQLVRASPEAQVFIHVADADLRETVGRWLSPDSQLLPAAQASGNQVDDLRFLCQVSQVSLCASAEEVVQRCGGHVVAAAEGASGCTVGAAVADGHKCQRCWMFCTSVKQSGPEGELCGRCHDVVQAQS